MPRSDVGAVAVISRRPNRFVVGLVLLIGLCLAWYWMRHERLAFDVALARTYLASLR
jgi:hypothetical protein